MVYSGSAVRSVVDDVMVGGEWWIKVHEKGAACLYEATTLFGDSFAPGRRGLCAPRKLLRNLESQTPRELVGWEPTS